jgi:predicted NAD-dependent protein-ADP-ribosyltransferase YbiA (DUF1768 family)
MSGQMPIYWPLKQLPENRWNSSEQLYQASKFGTEVRCLPPKHKRDADPCVRNRIKAQRGPRGAKMTQKCAVKAGLVRRDWEAPANVKLRAMLWVLELKLFWNYETFGAELTKTGKKPIVEISRKDDFWGCKQVKGKLVGQNHLGRLLMKVRANRKRILKGRFTYPKGFLLE